MRLPIVLLEALSYGPSVVIADIPANSEVGLAANCYFQTGDVAELQAALEQTLSQIAGHGYSLSETELNDMLDG